MGSYYNWSFIINLCCSKINLGGRNERETNHTDIDSNYTAGRL
jgi:hypothetical protein